MAISHYITCCKCGIKLIYDGNREQRDWWEQRWNKEPEIECPDCKAKQRKPLTDEEIDACSMIAADDDPDEWEHAFARAIEAAHGIKE